MPRPLRTLPKPTAMIVAPQPEAVEAGAAMLAAGGNAVDAVLACAFTQGVVDPLMCGVGGLGVIHIYDSRTGRHEIIDGLSTIHQRSLRRILSVREHQRSKLKVDRAEIIFAMCHQFLPWTTISASI